MPSRPPSRGEQSRAEARRRARLAAQGQPIDAPVPEASSTPPSSRGDGGFLGRIFPPAAPLPGHGRPLEGFSYAGAPAFRGVAEVVWLLAKSPLAWIGAGAAWAVSRVLTDGSPIGILMSVVSFGSLIAAGWFGWRRPWLFGAAAALLGQIAVLAVLLTLLVSNPGQAGDLLGTGRATPAPTASAAASAVPSAVMSPVASPAADAQPAEITPAGIALNVVLQTIFQVAIGAVAGWYGGYLRRRTAQAPTTRRSR